jgi:adenylosuccinate synthase
MNTHGAADIVVGTQYGDEGKARVVDDMAKDYDVIARFNGGANAGHTIEHNGLKVALNQVPSGIFYEDKILYVGSGCVINISKLVAEIERLEGIGINLKGRFKVSSQAGVVQPHHMLIDAEIGGKVGTTKNGIGPAYADRSLRMWGDRLLNIRLGDLHGDADHFFEYMKKNLEFTKSAYGIEGEEVDFDQLAADFEKIRDYIEIDTLYLQKLAEQGKKILFEGAQSFMLDVNKGSVPYVTSSGTSAPAAYTGGDLSPNFHGKTIGVAKAIMSRVGHGPFISEFGGERSEEYCMTANEDGSPTYGRAVEDEYNIDELLASDDPFEMGKAVRHLSGEYGTVSTRPRRIGALDLPQLTYAVKTNGINGLVLTKCDLLNVYSKTAKGMIPIVTGYKLDGEDINFVPGSTRTYGRVEPVIEYREAFSEDISHMRSEDELPQALKDLLKEVEEFVGCEVAGIGVGPGREQYVKLK